MTWIVTSTRQGKAMRAVAQDQDAARLMGINVEPDHRLHLRPGRGLAGAAGVLYMQVHRHHPVVRPGFRLGLIAFTAAVLGGIGNLTGAVLGGVLIGIIQGINDGARPRPGVGRRRWSSPS